MTKIDKILLTAVSTAFITLIVVTAVKNLAAAILIAFLISVTLVKTLTHFIMRRKALKVISVIDMENEIALLGNAQKDFFMKSAPAKYSPEPCDNGFTVNLGAQKTLIATNYKFLPTSLEDVARLYRFCKANGIYLCYVLGRKPQRNVCVFAASLTVNFRFVRARTLHRTLKNRNALPEKTTRAYKKRKVNLKRYFFDVFRKKRAKNFALSGICIATMAFISPFRTYYLIICGLCLVLAVVCLLQKY